MKNIPTDQPYIFSGHTDESKLLTFEYAKLKGMCKPMIICPDKKALSKIIESQKVTDGLIVFEYDHKELKARFKLFDNSGQELVLIKHSVEKNGAMKHSLLKHIRRSTLTTIAFCVRFSP